MRTLEEKVAEARDHLEKLTSLAIEINEDDRILYCGISGSRKFRKDELIDLDRYNKLS